MNEPAISVTGLNTSFITDSYIVRAVEGVSFDIMKGQIFGLVGESGCGKTMISLSIMRLVPSPGKITEGQIIFEGRDLVQLTGTEMESIRGDRIGMVFQEPMTALNPVIRIGEQISETIVIHKHVQMNEAKERSIDLLKQVGFDEPEKRYMQYPHQLSGGQRQRVLIAIAISCNPSLIIADEPTTALDVVTESQILFLLKELVRQYNTSMLFITHNLNIVRKLCNIISIMYAGRILEQSSVDDFFKEPLHPYSKGLLNSVFGFGGTEKRLTAIPGFVPKLSEIPEGCKFHPRCTSVMPICKEKEPLMIEKSEGRCVRCFLYE
ncbi:MAG: ABC transporter ATP-binding protein [Proteobacteria bacterium]|nr:ABC transporter ATP-binding protein [Pseudomonadota bacterium]